MSKLSDSLRNDLIRPVLKRLVNGGVPYSQVAENILMGTMAQESKLGLYARQLGNGPALGPFQMEPPTHDDIWKNFLAYHPRLANMIQGYSLAPRPYGSLDPAATELVWNWPYSVAMCRAHYFRFREPMPSDPDDLIWLGEYWKKYYNTDAGSGTVEEFVKSYEELVI